MRFPIEAQIAAMRADDRPGAFASPRRISPGTDGTPAALRDDVTAHITLRFRPSPVRRILVDCDERTAIGFPARDGRRYAL
jgi:hypothetical protein